MDQESTGVAKGFPSLKSTRKTIGPVIAGSMFFGTLVTLDIGPAVYSLVARDHSRAKPGWAAEPVISR